MMDRVATKSRYCYNTAVFGKIGRRVTLADRFRQWKRRFTEEKPDMYRVTGYYPAIYPEKESPGAKVQHRGW